MAAPKDKRTRKILIDNSNGSITWLGVKKIGYSWKWVGDGSTAAGLNWYEGYPLRQHCVIFQKIYGTRVWDASCSGKFHYICEF